ncbi:Lipase-like protein [Aphelenchoides fujianensis]|nr:Lipase-like protein [Aphelenchoides fujianensis]
MLLLSIVFFSSCFSVTSALPYNDTLARQMAKIAAAAYAPNHDACLRQHFRNFEVLFTYEVECDSTQETTCGAYLAAFHSEQVIAVVFRGTISRVQMFEEVYSGFADKKNFMNLGKINLYFHNAYFAIWNHGMKKRVHEVLRTYPKYDVYVTGHSLGAALSSLASLELEYEGALRGRTVFHYNFGEPRVGDMNYALQHTEYLPEFYRVTHAHDFVSDEFPQILGYFHHSTQVWYNNEMGKGAPYVQCAADYDPNCWDGERLSMVDHRMYFGINIPHWYDTNCTNAK